MAEMNTLLEKWKKQLLDLGRQNRLIHYRETKRGSLRIVSPDLDVIYESLVNKREPLSFDRGQGSQEHSGHNKKLSHRKKEYQLPENTPKNAPIAPRNPSSKFGFDLHQAIQVAKEVASTVEEEKSKYQTLMSSRAEAEERQIVKYLKDKAKTVMEEQGVHTLYLSFGFLKWNDSEGSYYSPLVLVPVTLTNESLHGEYKLTFYEEEIVVNPTLCWKLEKEFGRVLPEFDDENGNVLEYLIELNDYVADYQWEVELECSLSLFTYAKMKMYQDIEENGEAMSEHPILRAFSGDMSGIKHVGKELTNYNHDINSRPSDTFQVLDADASQQDAILYSNEGVSFVLQGPPGTGKSQTITNIIAEALARDKKVLFVSEKMAALEVVYKRLSEVGLAEFCLPLHSHKANKKEVLEEIHETLHMEKAPLYEEVMCQLDMLQEHRKRLNQYASELHTKCEPLHQSIYEVNGRLAKLYLRPNMEFRIANVEEKTSDELHQYMYHVGEYQKSIEKLEMPIEEHPWYSSTVNDSGYERRSEITGHAEVLQEKITTLYDVMQGIMEEYQVKVDSTFSGAYDLLHILKVAYKAPKITSHYVGPKQFKEALEDAKVHASIQSEYHQLKEYLDLMFEVDYEEIDAEEGIHVLTEAMDTAKEELNSTYFTTNNEVVVATKELLHLLEQEKSLLDTALRLQKNVANLLGVEEANTLEKMKENVVILEMLLQNPRPTIHWFDLAKWKSNYQKMLDIKSRLEVLEEQREEIGREFDIEVLKINAEEMLYRFETEYQSVYKMLKKDYRRDVETIRSFSLHHYEKLEDGDIVLLLRKVIAYQENFVWLGERADWLKRFLGVYYDKQNMDWGLIEKELAAFKRILDYYGDGQVPAKIKDVLLNGEGCGEEIKQAYYALQSLTFQDNMDKLSMLFSLGEHVERLELQELLEKITKTHEALFLIYQIFSLMNLSTTTNMPYSEGLSLLKKLKRYQQIEEMVTDQQTELKRQYPSLYDGLDTNWDKIIHDLMWLEEIYLLSNDFEIQESFIEACRNHRILDSVKETIGYLKWCISEVVDEFSWFSNLFEEPMEGKRLKSILHQLEAILNNESLLEQWCNYVRAKEQLIQIGLEEFVVEVEKMHSNPSIITEMFLKRFYQLWLDKMAPQFETVTNFQTSMLEDARNDFDKLDVSQLTIAKARIREKLVSNLPDVDTSFHGEDEIAILKRELSKKHKLPLRKLFEKIPNLLLSLKPCFMMSPLSVSLFLKQDKFHFDLVIFDEASQIRTEDAVGAILRGSQVIIAGDSEQLPPTSFFQSNTQSPDTMKQSFDSILEEAQLVLPERTLRWHYRSKHESLIAFSNAKIYNHNLITFPSTVEAKSNCGVEYIYVEDGRYDRGGKKNNEVEAMRVAELIMEEARVRGDRSLGVITFSESQQQEVERRLQILREQEPELESFFDENKAEPFFIKNLENVQGDERDTIIFSIGYGKDESGTLSMNFGPLSRTGGYRRLNVAITRAKYNIKLVGSFLPEEMRLENTTSEGVTMLYSYLQYARNRKEFLKKEDAFVNGSKFSAPFEESIYEYLVSHGYKVETKIGCSGYRIDLAVMHPTMEGNYVLGIECDGATYHAARTVRERERLRQTVLKDMGWNIYRIWSTDWIKNPFIEGQKLLEVVDEAIRQHQIEA